MSFRTRVLVLGLASGSSGCTDRALPAYGEDLTGTTALVEVPGTDSGLPITTVGSTPRPEPETTLGLPDPVGHPYCGDGVVNTPWEVCDDGNLRDGDGCSPDCDFGPPADPCPSGFNCRATACGDLIWEAHEQCDDGNRQDGDGCTADCRLEEGFGCGDGFCFPIQCGDGFVDGLEQCDDDDTRPLDGCDERCRLEPQCSADGVCKPMCGDGILTRDEECDDGNLSSGDGCSASCSVESGFACETVDDVCDLAKDGCVRTLAVTYRDVPAVHPDFEPLREDPLYRCASDDTPSRMVDGLPSWDPAEKATFGMVAPRLDADGKPQWTALHCSEEAAFRNWFRELGEPIRQTIPLFAAGDDTFVNRWRDGGERFAAGDPASILADDRQDCEAEGCVPCPSALEAGCAPRYFDGDPLYFPLDQFGAEQVHARISAGYGYPEQPFESEVTRFASTHNFHFTAEIAGWFVYQPDAPVTLDIEATDDLWVFVNGHLVLDLGGIHPPLRGTVVLDDEMGLGLEPGTLATFRIFHAQRQTPISTFRLAVDNLRRPRSRCTPVCGDGIRTANEQCDDGLNDGGYGECAPGCVLGDYCGDGFVQVGFEDCDDGNLSDDDDCPASCRMILGG